MMLRFFAATRGATVLEFALILPVLCALLAGGFELGYRAYVNAILQGALLEASRQATVGDRSGAQIDKTITDRMATLSGSISIQSIKKESFYNFSNVGKPEKLTFDRNGDGAYDSTQDCYEDANNNGAYDIKTNSGIGTADDIVRYTVSLQYPSIMPVGSLFGWGSQQEITTSTVLRNQPFPSRAMPTVRCP